MLDDDPELRRGDALAHPSRARLFAALSELRRVAKTAELAQRLELHPNGVRIHLSDSRRRSGVPRARFKGPAVVQHTPGWWLRTPDPEVTRHAPTGTWRDGWPGRSTHAG